MEYDLILKEAYEHGLRLHPDAPKEHHSAFVNSVAYAITAVYGGYGGPSMREHLASQLIIHKFGTGEGRCDFNQATELLDKCCYGELTRAHAHVFLNEECIGDAPGEPERAIEIAEMAF